MILRFCLIGTLAASSLLLGGCGTIRGAVYEHYRAPYTLNLNNTPAEENTGRGKIIKVEEPFSGYNVNVEFQSNAVGDIAARHGIKKVHWADMEYLSILGIWKEKRLHIYGE